MDIRKSKTGDAATKFWDRYIEYVQKQGLTVPPVVGM